VNARTRKLLQAAEKAATQLVQECRKGCSLYTRNPRVVAQVSRTGKWFLNALATLNRELSPSN
jgi:hypothetical protein